MEAGCIFLFDAKPVRGLYEVSEYLLLSRKSAALSKSAVSSVRLIGDAKWFLNDSRL